MNVSDRVDEPPELTDEGVAVGVPTVSAAFTVTVTVVDVTVTGVPELSVTCSSNVQVPAIASAPVVVSAINTTDSPPEPGAHFASLP